MNRPSLRGTKSNFTLAVNMNQLNSINDERVKLFLRTETNVRQWVEDSLQIKIKGDLYEQLRSGVVLCYLANSIQQDAIPKIQEKTKVEFKLNENISFFIEALEELGVPRHKRFQLADLYPGGNRVKVVESLVSLSEIAASRGYPTKLKPVDPKTPVVIPTHEALKELKYWLSLIKEPTKQAKGARKGATVLKTQMALLAGNSVDFAKCERGFIAFQTLWRGFKARKLLTKLKRDCAYRDKITQEIFKTEHDYVSNLNICITEYMTPLAKLLNKDQIKTIFSDIQIIHAFGQKLIEKLRPRIESWDYRQKLGDIFLEIADFLKVYTGYIQNYNNALTMLEEIRKKDKINNALNDCRSQPACRGFELTSFLIMPIQRVPRYNLLLMDLVKHTWTEHPDYQSLCNATERMKGIASFLNEKKREGENIKKFTDIQSCLEKGPLLFAPTRKFIKQGCFFVGSNNKKDEVSIFLFNDILVYGKPTQRTKQTSSTTKERKVKYRGTLDLITLSVVEDSTTTASSLQITIKSANGTVIGFMAKDEEEWKEWLEDLKKTIVDAREKDNLVKEAKAGIAAAKEAQEEPEVNVEAVLAERRKTQKTLTPSSLPTITTTPATNNNNTISLSTSVSLPNSPVTSPSKDMTSPSFPSSASPASPPSPNVTSINNSNREGEKLSFLSSILGKSTSNSNRKTKDEHTLSSEQLSDSAVDANETSTVATTADSSTSPSSTPTSPNTTNSKGNRPTKKKKQHSVDDIDIGTKNKTADETGTNTGGRARAQTRLQKLTGTFRRKKDKEKLEQMAANESTSSNEVDNDTSSNNNNDIATTTTTTTSNLAESNSDSGSLSNSKSSSPAMPSPKLNRASVNSVDSNSTTTSSDLNSSTQQQKTTLSLEEIRSTRTELDQTKLESYLSEEEFQKVFGMDQATFYKQPKWRQDTKKRELKLL